MTAPVYKSERAHKFRENFDTPDLAQMHGPVYESGRTHGYTQAEQVVVDQIPLHGPIYDLQNNEHHYSEINKKAEDTSTLKGPIYKTDR